MDHDHPTTTRRRHHGDHSVRHGRRADHRPGIALDENDRFARQRADLAAARVGGFAVKPDVVPGAQDRAAAETLRRLEGTGRSASVEGASNQPWTPTAWPASARS